MEITHKYDDIIDLPHHVSETRPRMSASARAAQFSPFAALTGYGDAVAETARTTERKIELEESVRMQLGRQLFLLQALSAERPAAEFVYFVPDARKRGGSYRSVSGCVKKVDEYAQTVTLTDGLQIPFDDILSIRCELLSRLEGSPAPGHVPDGNDVSVEKI